MRALLPLLVLLVGCPKQAVTPEESVPTTTETPTVDVAKAPLDDREYRFVELDNGLKVLLIQDTDTDMAAASLDVHVGQFSDPIDREGLAHFLEHMLFMGTEKYPDVDAYRDYIQSNGGGTNAGTGQQHTNYFFSVDQAHLEGGLDRFAQFFISPVLNPDYVEREREAVNSEYSLKIQSEARRFREIRRETSNPEHGFYKFSVGNLDTLADRGDDTVHKALKAFYEAEYSASRMALSVIGREDLDTLESWARTYFSAVPTNDKPARQETVSPYLPDQLGIQVNVTPLIELRRLQLEFPMPPSTPDYKQHPMRLLTNLVSQQGEGSLHALLNGKNWITSLAAYEDGTEDHSILTIRTDLTEAGFENKEEIVGLIFQYLKLIQDSDDLSPWWNESRTLTELSFKFSEPTSPSNAVQRASSTLQMFPPQRTLDYWATYEDYDPAVLERYLERLHPDNLRLFVTGPDLETDKTEPLYDVPWGMKPLTDAQKTGWTPTAVDEALTLPAPNPYLPTRTDLKPQDAQADIPSVLIDEPGLRVVHLQDTSFGVPETSLSIGLWLETSNEDWNPLHMSLVAQLLNDDLRTVRDQLSKAGVRASFSGGRTGMTLNLSGYDDRLAEVATQLLNEALAFTPDEARFQLIRDERVRNLRNSVYGRAVSQVSSAVSTLRYPSVRSDAATADYLESLDFADLKTFSSTALTNPTIDIFAHGNHTPDELTTLSRQLRDLMFKSDTFATRAPHVQRTLPRGTQAIQDIDIQHTDSAIIVNYPAPGHTLEDQAKWLMLGNLVRTRAFTVLRTEQQLGYIVWGRYGRTDMLPDLNLGIQSSVQGPDVLLERIDAFLVDYATTLSEMSDEEYETIKQGLISSLEEAPTTLADRTSELRSDYSLNIMTFDRTAQIVELLKSMPKSVPLGLLKDEVLSDKPTRFIVRALGTKHTEIGIAEPGCADEACMAKAMSETVVRER